MMALSTLLKGYPLKATTALARILASGSVSVSINGSTAFLSFINPKAQITAIFSSPKDLLRI